MREVGRWNGRREDGLRRKEDPRGMDGRGYESGGLLEKMKKKRRRMERTIKSRRGKEEGEG